MTQESQIVNLDDLVSKWAIATVVEGGTGFEAKDYEITYIDWKGVNFYHGATVFAASDLGPPRSVVLYSSSIRNNTSRDQVSTMKAERRTKSTYKVMMDACFTIGAELNLQIGFPKVVQAKAGLKGDVKIKRADEDTFEEELTWSVYNQLTIPPNVETRTELVLEEYEGDGKFTVDTKITGKVVGSIQNKVDKIPAKFIVNVNEIFKECQKEVGNVKECGVYFKSRGRYCYRFGIGQKVNLKEMRLLE